MKATRDQHKAGTKAKPRGQQMGTSSAPDQNREEMADTPALRGRRKRENKMFGDESTQHVGGDASTPKTTQPSTPAMIPGGRTGESGGETGFKKRLARKR